MLLDMPKGRSLLTEREREILQEGRDAPGHSANRWYNVRHRVRERMEELPEDLETLREHYPELYGELLELMQEDLSDADGEAEALPA